MTEILVTGARGFLGRALVPALRARGHRVHTLDRDRGDIAAPAAWAGLPRVESVVHLAARQFVPDSWRDPAEFLRVNVQGTVAALEFARLHGARVVFLSSYLYGEPRRLPIAEDAALQAPNPYALSKLLAEQACEFYATRLGTPTVVLRPFNIYGPGQGDDFLLPTLVRQARAGGPIRVKDLEPRRDYVHREDVVAAIVAAVGFQAPWAVFNIGSGRSHSVREVIDCVQRALGTELPVHSDGERRPGEIMDTVADIGAARSRLCWEPTVSFEAGIKGLCAAG